MDADERTMLSRAAGAVVVKQEPLPATVVADVTRAYRKRRAADSQQKSLTVSYHMPMNA